ncbi:Protein CBG14462 [Caenorhabditis briggsae]|uniref:Protein CBG14462 n=1 Tax=Caenorhabditis briggsae TaxID=6238 RepID=A8XK00_CAEBR|nr:Protein CBG14462 [Caenorhabditis briggsae]CAP32976.1 Protein CBG14462 [Caenorhabditis briggsae]
MMDPPLGTSPIFNLSINDTFNASACEDVSELRIAFISIGSCLSILGCASNGILLFMFLSKTEKSYPFQTFLAFLDFMLCALYIHSFGLLSISVEYKIPFLYDFVMDTNVMSLVMSRVVQLSIPYTLIANSLEKLTMILGYDCESRFSLYVRIGIIMTLFGTMTALRLNCFKMFFIHVEPLCEYFHRKWLSSDAEEVIRWKDFEHNLTGNDEAGNKTSESREAEKSSTEEDETREVETSFTRDAAVQKNHSPEIREAINQEAQYSEISEIQEYIDQEAETLLSSYVHNPEAGPSETQEAKVQMTGTSKSSEADPEKAGASDSQKAGPSKTQETIHRRAGTSEIHKNMNEENETDRAIPPPEEESSSARNQAALEIREQQFKIKCATETTAVIISAYLVCNLCNFVLYIIENFKSEIILDGNGGFKPWYVISCDVGSNMFVFSSAVRIFIYYKYNREIKVLIKNTPLMRYARGDSGKKIDDDNLLKMERVDV